MTDMLNTLEQADTQLLLFLNGFHNSFWDYFMMIYSSRFVWIPFYASFLYVMFRNYDWRLVTKCLVAIVAIVVLCDQTTSTLIKPMVERMRPSNIDNPISPMVHIVSNYRGGKYGFPSSHAACLGNGLLCHVSDTQQKTKPISVGLGLGDGILTHLYGGSLPWRHIDRNILRSLVCHPVLLSLSIGRPTRYTEMESPR